jgi:2,3-bisphosphoglycerate-dependent phosphoglycerate mutase
MGTLVLARHGITKYNQEKRHCGFIDIPITPEGEVQARTVATKIKAANIHFDAVYTSWLQRAWQTLDIIVRELDQPDLPVTKHPFLNERHYGDLQGMLHVDVIAKYGEAQFKLFRRSYDVRPPNGECLADVVYRAGYYLETVIKPRLEKGENILVVAHGNSNRAMVKILEHVSDADIVGREIAYDEPLIYHI